MGRSAVMFRFAAAIGIVLLGIVGAAADDGWLSRIGGRYTGQLRGVSQPLQITTTLRALPNDAVAGEYSFIEPGGTSVDGTLQSCGIVSPLRLVCRWRDRHGEGTLDMIFARDLQSFAGRWSSTVKPNNWYPWTGTRSALPGN